LVVQGAEGEVWLGVDEETQSMVALKFIPRGAPAWKLDMARREFSMLAQLGAGHLNIVRALEVVLTSKHLVLITEYVPGAFKFFWRHLYT
jgi:serine/threonine protein kinase